MVRRCWTCATAATRRATTRSPSPTGSPTRSTLDIGDTFALDGVERTVVGVVENPSDLDDEFALLPRSAIGSSESVTMLVDASQAQVDSFRPAGDLVGIDHVMITRRGELAEDVVAAVSVLTVAAVALFLVSLVAAASFVVIAQRRLRQLGMLAAVGATKSTSVW